MNKIVPFSPFKWLRQQYNSIKNEYLKRSPRGKWLFVRSLANFFLKFPGIGLLDPNFEIWWFSYSTIAVVTDLSLSFFYTVWYYWDSPIRGLSALPTFGVTIPSAFLYVQIVYTSDKKRIQELVWFSGEHIYLDVTPATNPKYIRVSNESAIQLFKDAAVILGLTFGSLCLFGIYPVYAFIRKHEIELPYPALLPFTHLDSTIGLFLNILNQMIVNVIGIMGTIGSEMAILMIKKTFSAFTMAIGYSIDELTDSIKKPKLRRSARYIDLELRNILIQVQDFNRYSQDVSDTYYWRFFLQPHMLCLSTSLALFFYLHGNWMGGIPVAIFIYTQLYVLCDIGEELNAANEKLLLKLHEMPWYLMSKRCQLDYAHALNRLQNGVYIPMGPFSELNYQTFSTVTNRIYTLIMTIIKFYT